MNINHGPWVVQGIPSLKPQISTAWLHGAYVSRPARAAFATGRYVHQNRLWDNAMPYTGDPAGWGHALQAKDIPVESIGKLHYRDEDDDAGFDVEHIDWARQLEIHGI